MRTIIAGVLAVALSAPALRGQTPDGTLGTGDRIRVTYLVAGKTKTATGSYMGRSPEGLDVRTSDDGRSDEREIRAGDLRRLEVSMGRSRGAGAGRGAIIGGLVGSLVGAAALCPEDCDAGHVFRAVAIGVGGGAGAGALIGSLIGREDWRIAPLPPAASEGDSP